MSGAVPNPVPTKLAGHPRHPLLSAPHLLIIVNLAILALFASASSPFAAVVLTSPLSLALLAAYILLVVRTDPIGVIAGKKADRRAGVDGEKGINQVGLVGRVGVGLTTGLVAWVASGWVMERL